LAEPLKPKPKHRGAANHTWRGESHAEDCKLWSSVEVLEEASSV